MKRFSFFFICLACISIVDPIKDQLQVTATIIEKPSPFSIKLGIDLRNNSAKPINVNRKRMVDFKRGKIHSIGNYVIEIQILEKGEYKILEPSADINPGFNNGNVISIGASKTLSDTICISGSSFARDGHLGFKPGSYRLRIVFNSDFWGGGLSAITDWVKYEIGNE